MIRRIESLLIKWQKERDRKDLPTLVIEEISNEVQSMDAC